MLTTHEISTNSFIHPPAGIDAVRIYEFKGDERISLIPEGRVEVMFQLQGDFLHSLDAGDNWEERPFSFIGGMHSSSYEVHLRKGSGLCLGITLRPACAHKVIGDRLNDFQNAIIDIVDVFGIVGKELNEKVMEQRDIQSQVTIIRSFLANRYAGNQHMERSGFLEKAISGLNDHSVASVADSVGLSDSQFRRCFREKVGLSPKRYAQIRRVNQAIKLMTQMAFSSLTDITYQLAYYDQSHFVREFRSVTGKSPKELRKSLQ